MLTSSHCPFEAIDSWEELPDGQSITDHNTGVKRDRNAIVLLIHSFEFHALDNIFKSLTKLKDDDQTDLIFFHEQFPIHIHTEFIANNTRRQVRYINVGHYFTTFPKGFDPYTIHPTWAKNSKWGYHKMIQFWFRDIFHHPCLSDIKYIMRLDDDSCIMNQWDNVFDEMRRKKAVYLANIIESDFDRYLPGKQVMKEGSV